MAKKKPLTDKDMADLLERLDVISVLAGDVNERMFGQLVDDFGSPIQAMRTIARAIEHLAALQGSLASKAANAEYQRDLEVKMRAELAAQKKATA